MCKLPVTIFFFLNIFDLMILLCHLRWKTPHSTGHSTHNSIYKSIPYGHKHYSNRNLHKIERLKKIMKNVLLFSQCKNCFFYRSSRIKNNKQNNILWTSMYMLYQSQKKVCTITLSNVYVTVVVLDIQQISLSNERPLKSDGPSFWLFF